jgi:hypothetical protein
MRPARIMAAFFAVALTASCRDVAIVPDSETRISQPEGHDLRGPMLTGWIIGPDGEPMEVSYIVADGRAIWQGDIDLGAENEIFRTAREARAGRARGPQLGIAIKSTTLDPYRYRWPSGKVPYVIPAGFPNPSRITDAMAHIQANTDGVDFVPRTTEPDYVDFEVSTTTCSSPVGRRLGRQVVRLTSDCGTGNATGSTIHELLHALGMHHEQSRCDRDTYILIDSANISSSNLSNFAKLCSGARDYGSYDEGSIMHYAPTAFSINGQPTIISRRGLDGLMGQRSGMSSGDRSTITGLYKYQPGARWSIFTNKTPATTSLDASPGWEVATRFKTSRAGCVVGLRFYRAAGETGSNTVKLWSESGQMLHSETFTNGTTGWNVVELRNHQVAPFVDLSVCIPTNTWFRVSVNTNTKQVKTSGGFLEPIVQGPLTADAGYYGQPVGSMPTTFSNSSYFVDVVFEENP